MDVWPYVLIPYLMCDRELEPLRFYALALIVKPLSFAMKSTYISLGFSVVAMPALHCELTERNYHKSVTL